MPVSPARQVAYRILRQVESGGVFAADLLAGRKVSELKPVDRNLANQLVMGVLRWGGELDYQIERLSGKPLKYFDPEVVTILRLGIFQIRFLTRVPKPAIVHEAVEMAKAVRKRSAGGLINAVLRKCERPARLRESIEADTPGPETLEMACRSIPLWLFERWARLFGEDAAKRLAWQSMMTPPATLYRVRGQAYDSLGEFERARADYEQALHLARSSGDQELEWQCLLDLGVCSSNPATQSWIFAPRRALRPSSLRISWKRG